MFRNLKVNVTTFVLVQRLATSLTFVFLNCFKHDLKTKLFNKIWLNKLEVMANAGDKKADYELSLYKEKEAQ